MEEINQELAPIVLFVYNRLSHTKKTIDALIKNKLVEKSELFIYSDGPKDVESIKKQVYEVRNFLKEIKGFKRVTIIESENNNGLANSVITGVSEVLKKYGKVIVLEDDLVTSENFLEYMNKSLEIFENRKDIWSISAYTPPIKIPKNYKESIYLSYRANSWGYATWADRWNKVDWEVKDYDEFINNKKSMKEFNNGGNDLSQLLIKQKENKINSWAIRWCYQQYKEKSYSIYPVNSKIKNIGFDGSGVHCGISTKNDVTLDLGRKKIDLNKDITINNELVKEFRKHFNIGLKGRISLIVDKMKLKKIIKKSN